MGQWTGVIVLFLSIGVSIMLATVTKVNLFIFIQALYTFIAPPFSAIFLLGMLWNNVSGKDALITIAFSFCLSIVLKILEFGPFLDGNPELAGIITPFANQGLITWLFAIIVCSTSAFVTPKPDESQTSDDLMFSINSKYLKKGLGTKWYHSVTFWWGLCFGLMIVLVLTFSILIK